METGRCLVGTKASLLSPFFLASLLVAVVKAEIRCYCNTPTCVTTGYMCKSELGICYSDLVGDYRKHSPPEHGCIDHRPESRSPALCPDGPADGHSRDWPLVQCCREDMCNYNDLPGMTFQTSSDRTDHERRSDWSPVGPDELPSSSAIWFRAAVIAVPITGAVILSFLVFVAIRMLRNEDKRHRKRHQILSALHRGYPYSQKTFISVRTRDVENELTSTPSNSVADDSPLSTSETKKDICTSHSNVTLVHWEKCDVTESIDVI
ncbi:BMP and activin membrane-bound inhibitor homolog [Branchiostoma floridae]|uniref:BMP and activin membrane-bound inhibitor homolog n=1 Tax=Branchiostoma floridae TaxID=7739 RepID=A0A9J7N3L4_BRAFL|nr:BMP and activin membrane-bound inhibitor homolog [Branchiostoma floridae]